MHVLQFEVEVAVLGLLVFVRCLNTSFDT